MFKRCITTKTLRATLALVGAALFSTCGGLSQRPLAPTPAPPAKALAPSKALPRAAKRAVQAGGASGQFSRDREGDLEVSLPGYGDDSYICVEKATFQVKKGSIREDRAITMTAFSGVSVNDVALDFSPDGLVFIQPATLTILLRGPLSPARLKAYHTASDGTVTQIPFRLSSLGKNRWQVTIQVPGFSIYSLGDDWLPIRIPEAGL